MIPYKVRLLLFLAKLTGWFVVQTKAEIQYDGVDKENWMKFAQSGHYEIVLRTKPQPLRDCNATIPNFAPTVHNVLPPGQ